VRHLISFNGRAPYSESVKSIGRIHQQTFIDTYTKVAFAKLYDRENALVAAYMLNDRLAVL
jgi:hypothetical protein